MKQYCIGCGHLVAQVSWMGGTWRLIDPGPVEGGELVVRGDPNRIEPGMFMAAFDEIGPTGSAFFGIPPNAPRYRQHRCGP